jgi:hypothetical protein
MSPNGIEPQVRVVAGCLFEVSLPESTEDPWVWANPRPEVTLLDQAVGDGVRRFRFRAEAAAADAGQVALRFRAANEVGAVVVRSVSVPFAPEKWPDGETG